MRAFTLRDIVDEACAAAEQAKQISDAARTRLERFKTRARRAAAKSQQLRGAADRSKAQSDAFAAHPAIQRPTSKGRDTD
jgi:uncharacterized protein YhaN